MRLTKLFFSIVSTAVITCTYIVFTAAISLPACAEVVPIRNEWISRDSRLSSKVTVLRQRVRIGELLEEAQRQTGVELSANSFDGADSKIVTIYARDIPLYDLMADVWSLVSYQRAAWRWEVNAVKGKPISYRLICPENARNLPASLQQEIQTHFEESMEASITAQHASPGEKKALIEKYPEAKLEDAQIVHGKIDAFSSLFTKAERLKLARGEMGKDVPRSEWTPEAQKYVDNVFQFFRAQATRLKAEGRTIPDPEMPESLQFGYHKGGENGLSPILYIRIGTLTGWAVVGSTTEDKYWQDKISDRWLMDGDQRSMPEQEARIIPSNMEKMPAPIIPGFIPPGVTFKPQPTLTESFHRLNMLNKQTGIPVLVNGSNIVLEDMGKKSVSDILSVLNEQNHNVKWRDGALMIANPEDIFMPKSVEPVVPWKVMQQFRTRITANDFTPRVEDFCFLGHELTNEQLSTLSHNGDLMPPNLYIYTDYSMWLLAKSRLLFATLDHDKRLLDAITSNNGMLLRDLPESARPTIYQFFPKTTERYIVNGQVPAEMRCRLRVQNKADEKLESGEVSTREFALDLIAPDRVHTVIIEAWPRHNPEQLRKTATDPEYDALWLKEITPQPRTEVSPVRSQ